MSASPAQVLALAEAEAQEQMVTRGRRGRPYHSSLPSEVAAGFCSL